MTLRKHNPRYPPFYVSPTKLLIRRRGGLRCESDESPCGRHLCNGGWSLWHPQAGCDYHPRAGGEGGNRRETTVTVWGSTAWSRVLVVGAVVGNLSLGRIRGK